MLGLDECILNLNIVLELENEIGGFNVFKWLNKQGVQSDRGFIVQFMWNLVISAVISFVLV
jgi:hypothetical protein